MRVNHALGLVIAGSVATMFIATREHAKPAPAAKPRVAERPWLSHEDAAQLVEDDGALGPLFAGLELGGPPPTPDQRAKVQAFARAHAVAIDLQVANDELVEIHLAVTYGGCCGYEGADWLAHRLGRWSTGQCCVCGEETLTNDWTHAFDDGVHLRGLVRVNRVEATWTEQLTPAQLVERADAMLGKRRDKVALGPNESWHALGEGYYRLELSYPTMVSTAGLSSGWLHGARPDLGILVHAVRGTVVDVTLDRYIDPEPVERALTARYGRRHYDGWRRAGHVVRRDLDYVFSQS